MSDNVIQFPEIPAEDDAPINEINPELLEKKKEALRKLPQFVGEVDSKTHLRHLPHLKAGEIFWVNNENKAYVVAEKIGRKVTIKALDEAATLSTGITIYEMNKNIVSKEPIFDFTDKVAADALKAEIVDWFTNDDDQYYLLYGRELHYITIFEKERFDSPLATGFSESLFDAVINIGELISMDFVTEGEKRVEIWVRTANSRAEVFYLMPYNKGIIYIKEQ